MSFAEELKKARTEAGITQTQMFELLGIPRRTVQDWERGIITPAEYVQRLIKKELKRIKGKELKNMLRLNEETRVRLIEVAKRYNEDELQRFQDELGWEDWMNEFTEAGDGEEFTEAEGLLIDSITEEIFRTAHEE